MEVTFLAGLIVASFVYGDLAFKRATELPDFYYLSPAVGVASGRGFVAPVPKPESPLQGFLAGQRRSLSGELVTADQWAEPDQSQHATRYLILLVGWIWKWTGISWDALGLVGGLLNALLVTGAYGLLRWIVPMPVAVVGGVWLATSTISLRLIPHLRDFSKGAFIIALVPLIVLLAMAVPRTRAFLALSLATGVLAGIGAGFKMDVAIAMPIAAVAMVAFRGDRPWHGVPLKLAGVAVMAAGFATAIAPVLARLAAGGSNAVHVLLLGWATPFDASLGIERSLYAVLPFYRDNYVANVISAHGLETTGVLPAFQSPAYDAASTHLWFALARWLPGDIVTRALAAADGSLNLLFRNPDQAFVTPPLPGAAWTTSTSAWLARLDGYGAILGVVFLLLAACRSVKHALLAFFLIVAVGGYPFLQYSDRHFFHTQTLSVAVVLGASWGITHWAWAWRRRDVTRMNTVRMSAVAVTLIIVGSTTGVVWAARAVQAAQLARALPGAARHEPVAMNVAIERGPDGAATLTWQHQQSDSAFSAAYYLVEFRLESAQPLIMGIQYAATQPDSDFSRVLSMNATPGANYFGFPAYSNAPSSVFAGITLGPTALQHFVGVYRLSAGPAGLPLDLTLPADWNRYPLHQRLAAFGADAPVGPAIVCAGRPACTGLMGALERAGSNALPAPAVGMIHAPIVTRPGAAIEIDGLVDSPSVYLVQLADIAAPGASVFIARGALRQGSVLIGLLRDRRWFTSVEISQPGEFVVALPIDQPGEYQPLITGAMAPGRRRLHMRLDLAGLQALGH